jgi:hypothetical protein
VRKALSTLPWVEQDSIKPDVKKQTVAFTIKDKKAFNSDELKKAIDPTGFTLGKVLSGP